MQDINYNVTVTKGKKTLTLELRGWWSSTNHLQLYSPSNNKSIAHWQGGAVQSEGVESDCKYFRGLVADHYGIPRESVTVTPAN